MADLMSPLCVSCTAPGVIMSLQWTAVATFLYMEVFFVLLLCIPFISPKRSESTSYMFFGGLVVVVGGEFLLSWWSHVINSSDGFYLGLSCKSLIETEQLCWDPDPLASHQNVSERFQP